MIDEVRVLWWWLLLLLLLLQELDPLDASPSGTRKMRQQSFMAFSKDTDNFHPATNKTLLEGLLLSMKCSFIRAPAWTKLEAGNLQRISAKCTDFWKVQRFNTSSTLQMGFHRSGL